MGYLVNVVTFMYLHAQFFQWAGFLKDPRREACDRLAVEFKYKQKESLCRIADPTFNGLLKGHRLHPDWSQ